jgi:hypothetical protein
MGEEGAQTLYTTDDTGNYTEYTPPEPPAFNDTLPEDLRESDHLKDVTDSGQLARYYVDLKSTYLKPPDTVDGYEFEKPEGFNLDEDTYSKFKTIAFENGVNQKQFTELMNLEISRDKAAAEAHTKAVADYQAETETALKTEWGDKYDQKLDAAKNFLKHDAVADEDFSKFLEDTKFGDNPQVIRLFSRLSDLISEGVLIKPGSGDGETGPQIGEDGRPLLSFPSMEGK